MQHWCVWELSRSVGSRKCSFIYLLKIEEFIQNLKLRLPYWPLCQKTWELHSGATKSLTVVDAFVVGDFCYFSKQKDCIKMSKRNYFWRKKIETDSLKGPIGDNYPQPVVDREGWFKVIVSASSAKKKNKKQNKDFFSLALLVVEKFLPQP